MSDVYALKQPHPDGSEWIQEFDSREEAVSFQSHSGGVLVRRERLPGEPGLWWVEDAMSDDGKCPECGKGIGHFVTCSQHPDYESDEKAQ